MPVVQGNGVEGTGHDSDLKANFNGLSAGDNGVVGSEGVEPPDQGLCVSSLQVGELVNNAFAIYSRSGSLMAGPVSLAKFFNENVFLSDPRCSFDPTTKAWFFSITAIDFTAQPQRSRVDLMVAVGADLQNAISTKNTAEYQIDTTDDGTDATPSHPGCPCLADQPLLGIDAFGVYLSTNEFTLSTFAFHTAQIYAISKVQLVALGPLPLVVHISDLTHPDGHGGTQPAFSVQPAITRDDSANAEFFLDSLDLDGFNCEPGCTTTFPPDNRIGVWALTNQSLLKSSGDLTLTVIVITSETYGLPVAVPQKPGSTPFAAAHGLPIGQLEPDGDTMQQVVFSGGSLWSALDTIVQVQGDPDNTPRDGVAWFNISPSVDVHGNVSAKILQQGYVAVQGDYLLYPSIALSAQGQAKLVVSLAGPDFFPTVAYALFNASDGGGTFGDIRFAAAGVGPEDGFSCEISGINRCRWGDYSAAVTDPSDGTVWMAVEFINQTCTNAQYNADTTCGGTRTTNANWATRVFQLNPRS